MTLRNAPVLIKTQDKLNQKPTRFETIPSDEIISKTEESLKLNGIDAVVVENAQAAKEKLLEIIPKGATVMNMTSVTLKSIGAEEQILNSGRYNPARKRLMDKTTTPLEKQAIGSTSEWAVGSLHAITQDGKLMIASNTGSQLGAEAYGSMHVLFVAGAQKIVDDLEEGMQRIYEYVLPKESERANKAYNITTGSFVSKILIINREINPNRIKLIIVKEQLGF